MKNKRSVRKIERSVFEICTSLFLCFRLFLFAQIFRKYQSCGIEECRTNVENVAIKQTHKQQHANRNRDKRFCYGGLFKEQNQGLDTMECVCAKSDRAAGS